MSPSSINCNDKYLEPCIKKDLNPAAKLDDKKKKKDHSQWAYDSYQVLKSSTFLNAAFLYFHKYNTYL